MEVRRHQLRPARTLTSDWVGTTVIPNSAGQPGLRFFSLFHRFLFSFTIKSFR